MHERLAPPSQLLAATAVAVAAVLGAADTAENPGSGREAGVRRQTMLSLAMLDLEPLSDEWFLSLTGGGSNLRSCCLPSFNLRHKSERGKRGQEAISDELFRCPFCRRHKQRKVPNIP